MAFPTIPTSGAGRLLTTNQLDVTAARVFPAISGLTRVTGDLLLAIVVSYQTTATANAAFTWSAGWTEFVDQSSATTMAISAAYDWADGSETTPTATEAATITGDASMILMSIPGAHATTPPEATAIANGTTAAADPVALDPAGWAAEDTLWVAVGGSGCTVITGTWDGITAAPTSYTGFVETGASDTSTVGDCEAAVAFRQLNASSENVATFTTDLSNARNSALLIAVRPAPEVPLAVPLLRPDGQYLLPNYQISVR